MSAPAAWIVAAIPLAAALLALVATYATGFDQRSAMPPDVAAHFYGFFLARYPLYAFALVYGLARILVAMLAPGPSGVTRRLVGGLIGLALLLAASLHPTFGGMVLRTGFNIGAIAFMNAVPMPLAYALGTAGAALAFGLPVGLGILLTGHRGHATGGGWLRRAGWAMLRAFAGFLALWFGAAIIGYGRVAGFGPWPRGPLTAGDLAVAALLLTLAALPHMLLVATRFPRHKAG